MSQVESAGAQAAARRVLITGAGGFLGSHLCERFLREGHEVIGVDNFITGSRRNLTVAVQHPRFSLIEHDITRPLHLNRRVDILLHLASPASPKDYLQHPIHTMKVSSLGTLHTLGMAKMDGARYVLASSSEVYGDPEVHPQTEQYWGHVNPIGPRSVYDEAKRFAEALCVAYRREHRVRVRIARIFNTYGPRMRLNDGRAIPTFVTQALRQEPLTVFGDGSQTRSFCFVHDLIEALYRLATREELNGEVINIGNPDETTILELAQKIKALTGSSSPLAFRPPLEDDPKRRRPDISRARLLLGWAPATSLAEGLTMTIPWFREHVESVRG